MISFLFEYIKKSTIISKKLISVEKQTRFKISHDNGNDQESHSHGEIDQEILSKLFLF